MIHVFLKWSNCISTRSFCTSKVCQIGIEFTKGYIFHTELSIMNVINNCIDTDKQEYQVTTFSYFSTKNTCCGYTSFHAEIRKISTFWLKKSTITGDM